MDRFENISPLDSRYADEKFMPYLSEESRIHYQARVEAALAKALSKKGLCSSKVASEIAKAAENIKAEEVYAEENITRHDVRALVNCIRKKVSDEAKPFVHFGATSYDIVDNANALRYREACEQLILPSLKKLEKTLIEIALREKKTVQIGRTHGQHAEPITFGFAIAGYANRLGNRISAIEKAKDNLEGKFSGAVGAYNGLSLFIPNPVEFEKTITQELGLKQCMHSTQVVAPESQLDLLNAAIGAFNVLANFADDMRNLQRSEISEVAEAFGAKQVGSSTMPHKRNPINFENVKSLWKEFMPRVITFNLDALSDHQRDLTNSASQRFIPELFAGLVLSADRLNNACEKLVVDRQSMQKNFNQSRQGIVAEPLYLLLADQGHPNAHEYVREKTLEADKSRKPLMEIVSSDASVAKYLSKLSKAQKAILENPENYIGKAVEKTEQVCSYWKKQLKLG
ncbi:MAG: adenylosuccinate lyase [Candidatus Diapherotrites archaeon]|uniref:Adenylosuccinate lyase n=1 Tax=Candidatus Iainarchaeum sp. TaxID=3101447 RepID=A0A939C7B3_9ARCH|nr:adenylosuccinate lyase [Candidatus Diapherotrites archaeon]